MSMKGREGFNRILKIIIILIAAALIACILTRVAYLAYEKYTIYDVKEVNAAFIIGKKIGLSADADVLNFGIVPPGGSSTKEMVLYHEYKEPLKIKIVYTGNIAEVIGPIEPFYLEPKIEKKVSISAYAVSDENITYTGTVKVFFIK